MSIRSQIASNVARSYAYMAGFIVFVVALSYVFGHALGYGDSLIGFAVLFSAAGSLISFYFGDQIVLSMAGARPANRKQDFDFFTVAENLAISSGLPKPKLYVIDDPAINAFATGRDPSHGVICATTGLLSRLDRREIEGVVAHELSHVKNYDIRMMAVVAVLAGTVAYASDMFLRSLWWGGRGRDSDSDDNRNNNGIFMLIGVVLAVLSPLIAMLIQLSISRKREYLADATGALLTRYPEGLARALEKIAGDRQILKNASNATAHLFISNPFKDKEKANWLAQLFDTHPPIKERITILRSM